MNYDGFDDFYYNQFENYELESMDMDDSESINMAQTPPGRRRRPNAPEEPDFNDQPEFQVQPNFPNQPGFPGQPNFPNQSGFPAQGPNMAPPYIIPQLPRGVMMPAPGTNEFNLQYDNSDRLFNMQSQFRRCLNRFTFIWFWNGRGFWFYPTFVGRRAVEGFIWRRGGWNFERINLNRIFYFRCF